MSDRNNHKLFDRSSYLPRTITVLNVVGAYIIDIYYNYLYEEAKKFKADGKVPSITEGYKHAVFRFVQVIDSQTNSYDKNHYTKLLMGINEFFKTFTSFNTLTVAECIDKITREFIPEDYYNAADKEIKRTILRNVLIESIKEFSKTIMTEFLINIIDHHDDDANIDLLKEKMTDILLIKREEIYHRFLNEHTGGKTELVDKNVLLKVQQENKQLIKETAKLKEELQRSKDEIIHCKKEIQLRNKQVVDVIGMYKGLNQKYKTVKEEYFAVKNKLSTELTNKSKVAEHMRFEQLNQNAAKLFANERYDESYVGDEPQSPSEVSSMSSVSHPTISTMPNAAPQPTYNKQRNVEIPALTKLGQLSQTQHDQTGQLNQPQHGQPQHSQPQPTKSKLTETKIKKSSKKTSPVQSKEQPNEQPKEQFSKLEQLLGNDPDLADY